MGDLELFCNICLSKIEINKKFKKTDVVNLLKLLSPDMPAKTLESYKKNNAGWKEDNLLFHFNKVLFPLFISALNIHKGGVSFEDNVITEKFDFRYLDYILKDTSKQIRELQEEIEEVKDASNMIPRVEHYSILRDKDKETKQAEEDLEICEKKLAEQRLFFEDKVKAMENRHQNEIKRLNEVIDKKFDK